MEPLPAADRHCFVYCGPERCTCAAREAENLLGFVFPALPVLETMCRSAGLGWGADKAAEMSEAVRDHLARTALATAPEEK